MAANNKTAADPSPYTEPRGPCLAFRSGWFGRRSAASARRLVHMGEFWDEPTKLEREISRRQWRIKRFGRGLLRLRRWAYHSARTPTSESWKRQVCAGSAVGPTFSRRAAVPPQSQR